MLTANVERWRDAGVFEQVAGRRLYVQRRDGDGPLLLLLHGFASSSYDFRELLALRPDRAALAFYPQLERPDLIAAALDAALATARVEG
jgi:hypothetical protein